MAVPTSGPPTTGEFGSAFAVGVALPSAVPTVVVGDGIAVADAFVGDEVADDDDGAPEALVGADANK